MFKEEIYILFILQNDGKSISTHLGWGSHVLPITKQTLDPNQLTQFSLHYQVAFTLGISQMK